MADLFDNRNSYTMKQSSTDLISRLKTRKMLGVGESTSGDIYRSKISQILGHQDQVGASLVGKYWVWHFGSAIFYLFHGLLALLLPGYLFDITFQILYRTPSSILTISNTLSTKFYGCSLLTISLIFWLCILWDYDKKSVRICMCTSSAFQILQLFVLALIYLFQPIHELLHQFLYNFILEPDPYVSSEIFEIIQSADQHVRISSVTFFLRACVILINYHFYNKVSGGMSGNPNAKYKLSHD